MHSLQALCASFLFSCGPVPHISSMLMFSHSSQHGVAQFRHTAWAARQRQLCCASCWACSPHAVQELDSEGRVVVTDHGAFVLFNCYGPALTSEDPDAWEQRLAYKLRFYQVGHLGWLTPRL